MLFTSLKANEPLENRGSFEQKWFILVVLRQLTAFRLLDLLSEKGRAG